MRWQLWTGRRERLVLALLGVFVLGVGLSIIGTLTDSIKGTVAKAYEETWRAPYDILVHIPLENGTTLQDLTEPNVLTTLPPGISIQQWDEIRHLAGVEVAAPIAVVGYLRAGPVYYFPSKEIPNPGKGVYRVTSRVMSTASGVPEQVTETYTVALPDRVTGEKPEGIPSGLPVIDLKRVGGIAINAQIPTFLVGIDPDAENRLVSLDSALTRGQGLISGEPIRTFTLTFQGQEPRDTPISVIPVLVNEHGLRDLTYSVSVEELGKDQSVNRIVAQKTWTGSELADAIQLGEKQYDYLLGQSGPIAYDSVASPYPDRWPLALSLRTAASDVRSSFPDDSSGIRIDLQLGSGVRSWKPTGSPGRWQFQYQLRGYFDSSLLALAKDPRSQMPLMTYRPAEATQVLDASGRPVNPPRTISGGLSPVGFLSSPPALLTTIEGASALVGDKAINAIQVKVSDAKHFTPETVARVRQIASEIQKRTGLVAEVTMGSSPMNVLVRVPRENGGWVEEVWIHKNASITTVQQVEFGYSGYAILVVVVGVLYTVATGLAGVTARRRELGIAIALGWPESALRWMVMAEQILFASVAGLLAASAAAAAQAPPRMVPAVFGLALLVYLPAIWASGYAAVRTAPGEALQWGDAAPGRRILPGSGVVPLAMSSLLGRPSRTTLAIAAMALPTALLVVLMYISRHLRGVLFTTLTGEYAALRVGPMQYAAALVALTIAAVTAFDLVRQNAADHRSERALLHALGWPRLWIAATMVSEGVLLGAVAGIVGDLLGVGLLTLLYGSATFGAWKVALLTWTLPLGLGLLTGLISSLVERRAWDRTGLSGIRPQEVARFGKMSGFIGGVLVLLMVGGVGYDTFSRLAAEWKAKVAAVGSSASQEAANAIADVLDQQNKALEGLDVTAYLATIDPDSQPYVSEQRHWVEDTQMWKQADPSAKITRSLAKVELLGANTAHVWVRQRTDSTAVASTVLETMWIHTADGRWLEHGRWHQVLQGQDVTVWYPFSMEESTARETLTRTLEALDILQRHGYGVQEPLTVEVFENPDEFRSSLGPYLASAGIGQFWTDSGEPLRFFLSDNPPNTAGIAYHLLIKVIIERTHNHAPLWFREGTRLYAHATMNHLQLQDEVRRFPVVEPLSPTKFPEVPSNVDRNSQQYAQVSVSGLAFIWYLQTQYGSETVNRVFDALSHQPDDKRLGGPATDPERNQLTIKAIERATGANWTDLSEQFMIWAKQQPLWRESHE